MPDGDRVHAGLSGRYQQPYKMLCDQFLPMDDVAREVAQRVKRDLHDYGDAIPDLLQCVAGRLKCAQEGCLFMTDDDWSQLHADIEKDGRRVPASNKRGLGLAMRACHELATRLQRGEYQSDTPTTLAAGYVRHIYDANFQESAPLIDNHYKDVDAARFEELLTELRPHVERQLEHLASQIARCHSIEGLHVRSQPGMNRPIGPDEDLSVLGQ